MTYKRCFVCASSAVAGTYYKKFNVQPGSLIVSIAWGQKAPYSSAGPFAEFAVHDGTETTISGSSGKWESCLWYKRHYFATYVGVHMLYGGVEQCIIPLQKTTMSPVIYTSGDFDEVFLSVTIQDPLDLMEVKRKTI